MEEALARAKDIILGSTTSGTEKSVQKIMQDSGVTLNDLQRAKELLKEEAKALGELKKELTELKAKQLKETMEHSEHQEETEQLDKELVKDEYGVGVAEDNVEAAEQVQEEPQNDQ